MGGTSHRLFRLRVRFIAVLAAFAIALAGMMPSAQASTVQNAFFTTRPTGFTDMSAFTKWTSVMPRYMEAKQESSDCDGQACSNEAWERMLAEAKHLPLNAKLDKVNSFFNAIPYVEDRDNWGVEDYWQTPYEFMTRGGDCEDYAIAKYISLKRLGVAESQMRIMIVQDNNLGGIMHAILQVTVGKNRYLLDNQASTVTQARDIYHYRPIYAINEQQWWAYQ